MAYDGEGKDDEPKMIRRQVMLTVRCVVDVPAYMDEDAVQFEVEEHLCKSDLIMSLAERIAYDDEKGECNVCLHAEAKLVPVASEVPSRWLNSLPQPMRSPGAAFGGDEEEEAEKPVEDEADDESDVEEEEEEDGDIEDEPEAD